MDELRLSPLRPAGTSPFKAASSGKSTPRGGSPSSFRRLSSGRSSPRRDHVKATTTGSFTSHLFRSNRILLWLLLITLWAYAGFYFQSRWAHGDNKEDLFSGGYGGESVGLNSDNKMHLVSNVSSASVNNVQTTVKKDDSSLKDLDVVLPKKEKSVSLKKQESRSRRSSRRRGRGKPKVVKEDAESENVEIDDIPKKNSTYGLLVGPFGSIEDAILEWSPQKRSGTCDRKGAFARLVWSRKFVLVFHELSMTGAPLAMMELASEFLSCGATISAIVLNRKGGLLPELSRRKIKVLEDKTDLSFKTAMRADLIIAGSAVCSSWIG